MASSAFARLDVTNRVVKRAQYEAFAFEIRDGGVLVRNHSHAEPHDHEYLVTVSDGVPSSCACPADERFEGACKHRVAVAIREPVLDAAIAEQVAADGGTVGDATDHAGTRDDEGESRTAASTDSKSAACSECTVLPGEFPCWECVRTGRRDLPE